MANWSVPLPIRERAVALVDKGMSSEEVAEVLGVGVRSVYRWRELRKARGSVAPLPHRSGNPARIATDEDKVVVRELLANEPDLSVEEATVYFVERTQKRCSPSAMGRALRRMGITRKKSR